MVKFDLLTHVRSSLTGFNGCHRNASLDSDFRSIICYTSELVPPRISHKSMII